MGFAVHIRDNIVALLIIKKKKKKKKKVFYNITGKTLLFIDQKLFMQNILPVFCISIICYFWQDCTLVGTLRSNAIKKILE
ncbi:hypothetical protein KDW_58680 [Dictyobacter vulcani]|uniref:Uncharacterized protein n=1 Tax=Dictyobacter vulcani TaxID=2607529 RepID=A0A5J4L2L6_9CHLR|nr:hypothetical protein KDW_58680 [Dictyobacter vulcani]